MRVAILCNGEQLARWQHRAVERIAGDHQLFVLACEEPPPPRRLMKHAAYYALNLATIRNRMTRPVRFPDPAIAIDGRFDCKAIADGAWSILPDAALDWLKQQRIDAIVKFGLGLLRVPDTNSLPLPILSFHHGDPRSYRGRPAGFWELRNGEPLLGQVVQILSNRLDAGPVLAFAESRTVAHSYRRTLIEAYTLSPYLLQSALRALADGQLLPMAATGKNFRLPGNAQVAAFVARRWGAMAKRLFYGAFVEKGWRIATARIADDQDPHAALAMLDRASWTVPEVAPPYCFYADPFFLDDGIVAEALHRRSGKGALIQLRDEKPVRMAGLDGHASYPSNVVEGGRAYLVPEVSEWRRPAIYRLNGSRLEWVADLNVDADRLLDPTFFRHDGRLYLFANTVEEGPSVLRLWSADSLFDRFEPHPASPIRLSARGGRMAGGIHQAGGQLWRFGQDSRRGYGDGVLLFRIISLSSDSYAEELAGEFAFDTVSGPHTINFLRGTALFDFYRERRSLLAGVRRLLARL